MIVIGMDRLKQIRLANEDDSLKRPFTIRIETKYTSGSTVTTRPYYFQASSDIEADSWIQAFRSISASESEEDKMKRWVSVRDARKLKYSENIESM